MSEEAVQRGVTLPAHHLTDKNLSFTCVVCGGHTSLTPPCRPAKTYLLAEPEPLLWDGDDS